MTKKKLAEEGNNNVMAVTEDWRNNISPCVLAQEVSSRTISHAEHPQI